MERYKGCRLASIVCFSFMICVSLLMLILDINFLLGNINDFQFIQFNIVGLGNIIILSIVSFVLAIISYKEEKSSKK